MDWKSWAFFCLVLCVFFVSAASFDFFQSRSTSGGSFGYGGFPGGAGGFYRPGGGGSGAGEGANNEEYYSILGIPKTSTLTEVKRAYRHKVVKLHPDKGGDEKQFKALQEAYEVLSDPAKRRLYDTYGKAGVEAGAGGGRGGPSPEDIFSSFFGRGRPGQGGGGGPRRSPNLFLQVDLTLEELYKGTSRKVKLNRQKVVEKRIVLEPKILEAAFERGMKDGGRVVLAGEAEGLGNTVPGDIIIQVRELKHPTFVRRNADLLCEMKVSLTEALTGFERPLRHLDGRQLWVKGKAGQVTRPGSVWILEGEGMPLQGEPSSHGRLFIKFSVEFPVSLAKMSKEEVERLKEILPKAPVFVKGEKAEEAPVLKAGDPRSFGTVGSGRGGGERAWEEEEDEDEEDAGMGFGGYGGMPRGEQVQCSQQ
ncbi:Hypothetical protein NocV09_02000250 [Nannochloropsis oceanica]